MAITEGCVNVASLIQGALQPPLLIDESSLQFYLNPAFYEETRPVFFSIQKFIFFSVLSTICTCIVIFIGRVSYLVHYWSQNPDLEQVGFYVLMLAIAVLGVAGFEFYISNPYRICYMLNQRFKLLRTFRKGWPKLSRKPETFEVAIYGLVLIFPVFSLVFGAVPIIRDYDPVHLVLKQIWLLLPLKFKIDKFLLHWLFKITSSIVLTVLTFYGTLIVIHIFMIILMFLEGMQTLSGKLFESSSENTFHRVVNQHVFNFETPKARKWLLKRAASKVTSVKTNRMTVSTKPDYRRSLRLFQILFILIRIGNKVMFNFVSVLVFIGIMAASWSGYVMVKLFSKLPLVVYMACSLVLPLAIIVDFFLVSVAAIQNKNGIKFLKYWKRFLTKNDQKMQLRACPEIGYEVGPIRNCKRKTALTIADNILNVTATLVVLKVSGRH